MMGIHFGLKDVSVYFYRPLNDMEIGNEECFFPRLQDMAVVVWGKDKLV